MTDKPVTDFSLREYLSALAGDAPAPGGGSAAALAAALAAACAEMVGNFTIGRKKYADVEEQIRAQMRPIAAIRERLTRLVQDDVSAYSAVGAAYAMPKSSSEEKSARTAAIQEALRGAAEVPLELARQCRALAGHLPVLLEKGNPNLASDVGVAARLAEAAFDCAWLNVEVNLAHIEDEDFAAITREELDRLSASAHELLNRTWAGVAKAVTGEG